MAALSAAALELEHARVAVNKAVTSMALEPLKVIVKCVFKLKGMPGASKLTKKDDLVTYLEQQGDISALCPKSRLLKILRLARQLPRRMGH